MIDGFVKSLKTLVSMGEYVLEVECSVCNGVVRNVRLETQNAANFAFSHTKWSVERNGILFQASDTSPFSNYLAGLQKEVPSYLMYGTPFQTRIWLETMKIPFAETISYKELAARVKCGSPRSIGQALNRNPLPLIVPCHRVIGSDGNLVGFSAGIETKRFLVEMEQRLLFNFN